MADLDTSRDMFESQELEEDQERNWRGVPLNDLKSASSTSWPAVVNTTRHTVLFKLPISNDDTPLEPHPSRPSDVWDANHVRMPHSSQNIQAIQGQLKPKWGLIKESLGKTISSSQDLEKAILSYHPPSCSNWSFKALHSFFGKTLEEAETTHFFENVLRRIINLALEIEDKFRGPVPLLKKGHNRSISMTQLQAGVLLANAFLCTFPRRTNSQMDHLPSINFSRLFQCDSAASVQQKLKCFVNYFNRISASRPRGVITFTRRCFDPGSLPKWSDSSSTLTGLYVSHTGTIEDDGAGLMEVDFANRIVGGGVLGFGCVQEEIKFLICPELVVARLFTEGLGDTEALIVTGCERFNAYEGYGSNFTWSGNHKETKQMDEYRRNQITIVAIDALSFKGKEHEQYKRENINRELNKAYAGFQPTKKAIATGNWGCGVFGGDVQLKSIIQLMAASVCGKSLAYFTFNNKQLMEDLHAIHEFLVEKKVTVGMLWQILTSYVDSDSFKNKISVFEHIYRVLTDETKTESSESKGNPTANGSSSEESGSKAPVRTSPPPSPQSAPSSSTDIVEYASTPTPPPPPKSSQPSDQPVVSSIDNELTTILNGSSNVKQKTVESFSITTDEGKRRCLRNEQERWRAYETAMTKFKASTIGEPATSNESRRAVSRSPVQRRSLPVKRKITDYFQKRN